MTEAEWLSETDGNRLISRLRSASDRKLRLTACGWCHVIWSALTPLGKRAVGIAEGFADGLVSERVRVTFWLRYCDRTGLGEIRPLPTQLWLPGCAVSQCGWYAAELGVGTGVARREENDIIRDIFGNPFRPVAFDPAWRTEHAVGIAAKMYDERAFAAMPILADALEEAGCDNHDILAHCREPGVHIRGCWVVDLVLEKE